MNLGEALLHLSSGLTACCTGKGREIYDSIKNLFYDYKKFFEDIKGKLESIII